MANLDPIFQGMLCNQFARDGYQFHVIARVAEVDDGIPIRPSPLRIAGEYDPMDCALQHPVGPIRQQVPDVHENWRECTRDCIPLRDNGYWCPGVLRSADFKPWLRRPLEQQRNTAIVRVGPCTDIYLWPIVHILWDRGIM